MPADRDLFSPKSLAIIGCGGHARSVADVYLNLYPHAALFFVDENAKADETIMGFPVQKALPREMIELFIAFGSNEKRKHSWEMMNPSKSLITIASSSAQVSAYSLIGNNVFIGNFAHIGPEASVGKNTIINTGAIIEHEVQIGDHCHIGPNAVISGRSTIGNLVFIGVGAIVKDSVTIGSNIVLGAGAVAVKDLLEPGIYIGCPARCMKSALNAKVSGA